MSRTARNVGIAVVVVILVLIAIPFFISVNTFRPTIEQQLSSALGRQVQLGNLSLSIFSGALSAESLSIADDPKFSQSPFLTAKSLNVGVEVWPLIMSKTLNVTGLTIDSPEVNLIRNPQGDWNFSSLANSGANPGRSGTSKAAQSAKQGESTPAFSVKKLRLKNGRITVSSTNSRSKSVYDDVNLEASDVSLTSQFPLTLTANLPGNGKAKLDGKAGPVDQSDASLTPLDAKLDISGLDLAKSGFADPASGIAGLVDLSSTLRSQQGLAKLQGNVLAKQLQMAKGGSPAPVPVAVDFNTDYNLRKNSGVLNQGVVKIGQAVAHLAGTFETRGESTLINMKLDGQNLPVQDLQAVLPALGVILPKGSSLRNGTINANLNAQGPVDKLVTTGTVGLFNAQLSGFDLGSKLSAISKLTGGAQQQGPDTTIQKLTSNLRMDPAGIQTSNLLLVVPAIGQLTGGGTIASNNALNLKMVATLSGQGGVGSVLGGLTGKSGANNLPFLIQGTTSDPKFVPDVGGMVSSQVGGALGSQGKGLGDALGGLFGKKKK